MKLTFLGAAGSVTGSCYMLETAAARILLECGQFQGSAREEARKREPLPIRLDEIDAVVLSHAHIDHSGRLPLLPSTRRSPNCRAFSSKRPTVAATS